MIIASKTIILSNNTSTMSLKAKQPNTIVNPHKHQVRNVIDTNKMPLVLFIATPLSISHILLGLVDVFCVN